MEVVFRAGPVPHRDDQVALEALRARRLGRRQFALGDAVGPVAEHLDAAEGTIPLDGLDHVLAGLPGLNPAHPRVLARLEVTQQRRQRTRRLGADGVTVEAAVGLEFAQELRLRLHSRVDAVAVVPGTGEFVRARHVEHREPVHRRIIFGRSGFVRRRHRGQVDDLARCRGDLRRVDQAIAAHPHGVVGLRQGGHHVAPLIVGDHDLDHAGREIVGLRDHPYAGFRTVRTAHDAAEIGVADADGGGLLGPNLGRHSGQHREQRSGRHAQIQASFTVHVVPPVILMIDFRRSMMRAFHARHRSSACFVCCTQAISAISLLRIACPNELKFSATMTNAPGPPMTLLR